MRQLSIFIFCCVLIFETTHALHEGCVDQSWCKEENSYCSPGGFCSCKPDFTEIKIGFYVYACIKVPSPVSGMCNEDVHCNSPAQCDQDAFTCVCPSETHSPSLNMTSCLEYAQELGSECKEADVCNKLQNSECFSGSCMCKTGHVPNLNHTSCLKIAVHLSQECTEDVQCQHLMGTDTTCTEGKCFCKYGYAFDANRTKCYHIVEKVGDSCVINEQCVFPLGHAKCNKEACKCATGYVPNENDTECVSE